MLYLNILLYFVTGLMSKLVFMNLMYLFKLKF